MPVIGYARVSTTDQDHDVQLEALKQAGAGRIYQEKISGVRKDRPELVAMLDYVRDKDTVIVTKLDRIARSTKHLLEIIDQLLRKKAMRILIADDHTLFRDSLRSLLESHDYNVVGEAYLQYGIQ